MKAMGKRIREQREKWGYTLEEVGKHVGVSKSTLSKLENGLLKRPQRTLIDDLAHLFDCDPRFLFGYNHDDEVTLTYSVPGKEDVVLTVEGKPIIGEAGLRAKLYKAALNVSKENLEVAIQVLNSLGKGADDNAPK